MKNARHAKAHNADVLNGASTALPYGGWVMIDYFSLALGHGLLAIAFLRLVMRPQLDVDPRIQGHIDALAAEREAGRVAGRNARRRKQVTSDDDMSDGDASANDPLEERS